MSHVFRVTLVVMLALLGAGRAHAQQLGFALDHFSPAERGSEWFATDSLDLRGDFTSAFGITSSWAYRPLVARDARDDFERSIVRNQFVIHIGGSLVLSDRVRVGLNLPLQAYADGFAVTLGNTTFAPPQNKTTLGDIRLSGDVRILGKYGDAVTLAAGLMVWLPTGDRASYSGDGGARIVPQVLVAGDIQSFVNFVYAARLGFSIRTKNDEFADSYIGSAIVLALSGGVRVLDKRLVVGPEILTQTAVSDGRVLAVNNAPLELLLGAHYSFPVGIRVGAGFGLGLTSSFRAPQHRGLISVEWAPGPQKEEPIAAPLPPDRDRDTVLDAADSCPDQPGDVEHHGCPPPAQEPDRDGDGLFDSQDKCPDRPGTAEYQGCPPPDRDGDQVLDANDACPDEAGDPASSGCPVNPGPKDQDKDGVLDANDACPNAAGPWSQDPKRNGCPKAFVDEGQIKILDQVKFQTGKATIVSGKDSEEVLIAVWELLEEHPEITQLRVEGHTDDKGNAAKNRALSQKRAEAVVEWLTKAGIPASHLSSAGYGPDRPIADNSTEEGRQQNRRVEFHIQK